MPLRPLIAAAVLLLTSQVASAQYVWLGPYGSPGSWRHATWQGGLPPVGGGAALTIDFPYPFGSQGAFTISTFDRGAFVFNAFTFSSPGGRITLAPDGTTSGNSLIAGGTDPRIVQNGLGTIVFQNAAPTTNQFGGITVTGSGLGRVVFDSAIAGSGGLTIDYAQPRPTSGRVILGAPDTNPNNFTGNVTLNAGNLTLGSHVNPLGNAANTLVVNGGTISVQPVTTTQIVVPNPVSLNADLVFTGAADPNAVQTLTLSNAIAQASGIRHVEVRGVNGNDLFGAGTLILQGANTYSGNTVVGFSPHYESARLGTGGVTLSGSTGSALSSPEFGISEGGTLTLDSAVAGNHAANNRIHDAARVALFGSHFRLNGTAGAATSETMGPLDVAGGSSVTVDAGAAGNLGTSVQFSSLARAGRSAVLFRANNPLFGGSPGAATANMTFTTAPSLVGGGAAGTTSVSILPYAYAATTLTTNAANGTDLVTYGPNGIRALAAAEYATTIPAGVTLQNVKLSAQAAFTGSSTVNSLVLAVTNPFTTGSSGAITVNSGTVLASASATVGGNIGIDFGSSEAHIIVTNSTSTRLTISGVLSGTNGLTKSGPGILRLSNSSNTITGPAGLTINEGTVEFVNMFNFGTLAGVTVNGKAAATPPGFFHSGPSSANFGLPVTVNGGFVRFDASTATLTVSGRIQGTGGVVIDSTADVRLTATNNTYEGTTRVHAGRLIISSDANLGNSSAVVLVTDASSGTPGRMRLEGDWTTSRMLRIADSSASSDFAEFDTNGFNATLNGPLVGAGVLRKNGAGRLTLTQPTDFGQGVGPSSIIVTGGELRVMNTTGSATGFARLTIQNGATLSGTGRVAFVVNLLDGSVLAPGADGIGTLRASDNVTIGGRYAVDVSGGTSDRVVLSTMFQVEPTAILEVSGTLDPGTTYTLAEYGSLSTIHTFGNVIGLPATHALVIGPTSMQLVPVPEPTTTLAMALAAATAGRLIRRRAVLKPDWLQTGDSAL